MTAHYSERSPRESAALLSRLVERPGHGMILITGATILSMDPAIGDLARGDLLIRDDRIAAVAPRLPVPPDAVVIEAGGTILIPGLIDGHRHCWQNSLRRLAPDANIDDYFSLTHGGVALHCRPDDMYAGNLVSLYGALDSGVTTVLDFSHNSRSRDHSDAVLTSYAETGIRAVHASAAPNLGEWEGQWPEDLARLRDRVATPSSLVTVRLAVDVHRVRPLPELIAYARDLGIGVHIDGVLGTESSREVEQLGLAGVLGSDVTLIHCTLLGEGAWEQIALSGAHVTLATTSDEQIGLGDGIPPIQLAIDHGVRPALSVDVELSLAGDMFTQMRTTLTTQRMFAFRSRAVGAPEPPALLTTHEVLEFATVAGAEAVGLGDAVGSLTPGKQADLVVITADDVNNLPLNSATGTVVLGTDPRNVDAVFVAGRLRKWAGQLVDIDLKRLRRLAYASRDHLTREAGISRDVVRPPHKEEAADAEAAAYLSQHYHA